MYLRSFTSLVYDRSLNYFIRNASFQNGFKSVSWSPLGCGKYGRCLLLVLTLNHSLTIHHHPRQINSKWPELYNFHKHLKRFYKTNGYYLHHGAITDNVMKEMNDYTEISNNKREMDSEEEKETSPKSARVDSHEEQDLVEEGENGGGSLYPTDGDECLMKEFKKYKQRCLLCAIETAEWFPKLLKERFALLVTGIKSGHLIFWRVDVKEPLQVKMIYCIELESFWPLSVAYSDMISPGVFEVAVGFSSGLIKLYTMNLTCTDLDISVEMKSSYVIWGDADNMPVQWLQFQYQNNRWSLTASKGATVVVFDLSSGILTSKPVPMYITGIHKLSITGITPAKHGWVYTCAQDGTIQAFKPDNCCESPECLSHHIQSGFGCNGISVSPRHAFLSVYLIPTIVSFQLSRNVSSVQFCLIPLYSLEEVTDKLLSSLADDQPITDLLQLLHIHISQNGYDPPSRLVDLCSTSYHLDTPMTKLQKVSLISNVISSHYQLKQYKESSPIDEQTSFDSDWGELTSTLSSLIATSYMITLLKSWLDYKKVAKTGDGPESLPALLACDWLLMNNVKDADGVQTLTRSVYEECNEAVPQLKATLINDREFSTSQENLSDSPKSATELTTKMFESKAELLGLPSREKCIICQCDIWMDDLEFGTCRNGHQWPRCSIVLKICSALTYPKCQQCGRCRSTWTGSESCSVWLKKHFSSYIKCIYCVDYFE